MQCHYEVLDLPRDVSSEDLKKAYRKLVLQWHPDKNLGNTQECKERFQLIQQAYDVLSDPQERAWYDKHREEILKGGENFKDDSLNVFQYFTTSSYSGYGDDDKGFFTVYRNVFETLAAEDTPFLDQEELMPSFGKSPSPYEEVVHLFYSHWQSYCTAKTYVWIEAYDIREAPNRRVLRLMEKENKKLRDQAKKARNEEVRELVAFVRKRDPRVQEQKKKIEERKVENQRKAEALRKKAILERNKELSNYNECEWSNMSKLESNLQEIEAQLDNQFGRDSDSEIENGEEVTNGVAEEEMDSLLEEEGLYCIACDKIFQSLKAKSNHDNSKKHRENVALLKGALEEEDHELDTQKAEDEDDIQSNEGDDSAQLKDPLQERLRESDSDSQNEEIHFKQRPSRNNRRKKKAVVVQDEMSDDEELSLEKLNSYLINGKEEEEVESATANSEAKVKKKRRKAKSNKPTESSVAAAAETNRAEAQDQSDNEIKPQPPICGTCKSQFQTRNKLFSHLKTTNHSVYLENKGNVIRTEKPTKEKRGKTRHSRDVDN